MNVLLTCVGGRDHVVQAWRAALGARGHVVAADARDDASALRCADVPVVLPRFADPAYPDALLRACREHGIDLVVPCTDGELPLLGRECERLAAVGTRALVSSELVVRTCLDKVAAGEFLAARGFDVPATRGSLDTTLTALRTGALRFPLVVKPRFGSGSVSVETVRDEVELDLAFRLTERRTGVGSVIAQERIEGDEYNVDVVNDLDGHHVGTLLRRKLHVHGGSTDRALIVDRPDLRRLGEALGRSLGHVGVLDCDVLMREDEPVVIDLNPRFGAGHGLSTAAGSDLPSLVLSWLEGATPDPRWLHEAAGSVVALVQTPRVLAPLDPVTAAAARG